MSVKDIEEAVYYVLSANTDVTASVSTRIYPKQLPQEAIIPAITFYRMSGTRVHVMGDDVAMEESLVQISIWANSLVQTRVIADAVRVSMQRWRGTYGNITIHDSLLQSEYDDFDDGTEQYECVHEYRIFHSYSAVADDTYLTTDGGDFLTA